MVKYFILLISGMIIYVNTIDALPQKKDPITNSHPSALIKRTFKERKQNYVNKDLFLKGLYTELIFVNEKLITNNKASIIINKCSYLSNKSDKIWIDSIKTSYTPQSGDRLKLIIKGGPSIMLKLDVVKNPFLGCDLYNIEEKFNFCFNGESKVSGKLCYIIDFDQKYSSGEMLFRGKIYIDKQSFAILKMDYSMNVECRDYAYSRFFKNKPKNSEVKIISANYSVSYKEYNNRLVISDSDCKLKICIINKLDNTYDNYYVYNNLKISNIIDSEVNESEQSFNYNDILQSFKG